MKNEKGFTLVELVVAIAILGVLAIIGITRFAGITDKSRLEADYATAAAIATVTQAWIAQGDHAYTGTIIALDELKKSKYLIDGMDYESQTNGDKFTIDYDHITNSITVKAGTDQFYPIP